MTGSSLNYVKRHLMSKGINLFLSGGQIKYRKDGMFVNQLKLIFELKGRKIVCTQFKKRKRFDDPKKSFPVTFFSAFVHAGNSF